jgi:TRAP-type C4-dicarboxylate transport system permease large subunit
MTAMIFFMFVYASGATQFFAMTNIPTALADFIRELTVSPYLTISLILFMYLILGCLMPALPVLILTLPVIFPTVITLGFDPIWFGVMVVMMAEIGVITPPIGITVFAVAGVSDVPMYTIFRGVFPFWIVELIIVTIIVIFPGLALFLPNLLMGG